MERDISISKLEHGPAQLQNMSVSPLRLKPFPMTTKPRFRRHGLRRTRVNDKMIVCHEASRWSMKNSDILALPKAIRDKFLVTPRSFIFCLMHSLFGAVIQDIVR